MGVIEEIKNKTHLPIFENVNHLLIESCLVNGESGDCFTNPILEESRIKLSTVFGKRLNKCDISITDNTSITFNFDIESDNCIELYESEYEYDYEKLMIPENVLNASDSLKEFIKENRCKQFKIFSNNLPASITFVVKNQM